MPHPKSWTEKPRDWLRPEAENSTLPRRLNIYNTWPGTFLPTLHFSIFHVYGSGGSTGGHKECTPSSRSKFFHILAVFFKKKICKNKVGALTLQKWIQRPGWGGGVETWNLCGCLWRPSCLWLIFTGPGRHGPLTPWIRYWCGLEGNLDPPLSPIL